MLTVDTFLISITTNSPTEYKAELAGCSATGPTREVALINLATRIQGLPVDERAGIWGRAVTQGQGQSPTGRVQAATE